MNILITGASSGLGLELAKYYSSDNNNLFLLARRGDRLQSLQNELKNVHIYTIDVSDFDKLQEVVLQIVSSVDSIDLVIANAGISLGHSNHLTSFDDFKRLFDTNFLSIHALLTPIIPKMQQQKSGKIVAISSLASIVSMPSSIAYSSSKRAINSYCEGLRNLLVKDNIQVINILPGFVKSEMTDKNKFKMPFLLDTNQGVKKIVYAIDNNKREYKFPTIFFVFIKLVSILPISIKDKIIQLIHTKK